MSEAGVLIQGPGWNETRNQDMNIINRSGGVTVAGTMLIADVTQSNAATTNVLFGDLASIWVNFIGVPVIANGWRFTAPLVITETAGVAVGGMTLGRVHGIVNGAQVINTPAGTLTAALGANSGCQLVFPPDGADQAAGRLDLIVTSPGANGRQLGMTMGPHTVAATVETVKVMFRGDPARR